MWAELKKIVNSNIKVPLNEQLHNFFFTPTTIITTTGTWICPKSGKYRVICVGAGGNGSDYSYGRTGGAGGVAIKNINMVMGTEYNITVGTTASFSSILTATAGQDAWSGSAGGGTGSGGDYNYTGQSGKTQTSYSVLNGSSVGVFLSGLTSPPVVETSVKWANSQIYSGCATSGYGILGFGYSGGISYNTANSNAFLAQQRGGAAVIIQLIEEA